MKKWLFIVVTVWNTTLLGLKYLLAGLWVRMLMRAFRSSTLAI